MSTVIDTTVASGFCCGCGVCAGVCPQQNLVMQLNEYGELNPVKISDCKHECGLCQKVCPFIDGNDNEDVLGKNCFGEINDIKHRSETGYYLSSGVGAVSDEGRRMASASGGLASWYLSELLLRDIVDAVICVGHSKGERLFSFFIAQTPEEVYSATGSAYYPVEISEMLHYIKNNPGRYAVIGLPCVLKGIRLAQKNLSWIRERVVMLIGLACSNLKSTRFVEYAAYKSGLQDKIAWCSFRYKSYDLPRNFFKLKFLDSYGNSSEIDWGKGQLWDMYLGRCLTLHACDCCDDMHAELADVTFMDAWLSEYNEEPRGTSLYITRNILADELLNNGVSKHVLQVEDIPIEKVILAQDSLFWKRDLLRYRLTLMQENGENILKKRVDPSDGSELSILNRDKVRKCLEIQRESRFRVKDGFDAFGEWFDECWVSRPLLVRCYYSMLNTLRRSYILFYRMHLICLLQHIGQLILPYLKKV